MGGVDHVVVDGEVSDHWEEIRIDKHIVSPSRELSIRGDAGMLPWGLSPDLGLGTKVHPPLIVKQGLQEGDVLAFRIEISTYASRAPRLGLPFLAYGLKDKIGLVGLDLVPVPSSKAIDDEHEHIVTSSYFDIEQANPPRLHGIFEDRS